MQFVVWSTFFALIINIDRSRSILVIGLVNSGSKAFYLVDDSSVQCISLKLDESPSGFKQRFEEQTSLGTIEKSGNNYKLTFLGATLYSLFDATAQIFNLTYFNQKMVLFDSVFASNECLSKN